MADNGSFNQSAAACCHRPIPTNFTSDHHSVKKAAALIEVNAALFVAAQHEVEVKVIEQLSPIHRMILELVSRDKRPDEIAGMLGYSVNTVRKYIQETHDIYGVRTTTAAVCEAIRNGDILADSDYYQY